MRRALICAVAFAVVAPASVAVYVAAAQDAKAVPASAAQVVICPPVGGKTSDILYYLLFDAQSPITTRHTYADTGTTDGLVFNDGSGPWKRVVHEFRSPIVRAVCQDQQASFEAQFAIQTGPVIQGELFQVMSTTDGTRVGTAFIDSGTVGRQATGGGLALQQTFAITRNAEPPKLVLQNVSLLHSAFESAAMDGAKPKTIERNYFAPARMALAERARGHLSGEQGRPIGPDEFRDLVKAGTALEIHYDIGDPGPIVLRGGGGSG